MIYDKEMYRHSIVPQIKLWIDSRPNTKPVDHISNLALTTNCPIVVVCEFVEEMYGASEELTRMLIRLREFYA